MSGNNECKFKPTERVWLYVMVWFIFLDSSGCAIKSKLDRAEKKLNAIEQKLDKLDKLDKLQTRNVTGETSTVSCSTNAIITHKSHDNIITLER
jgi:hypothetical protein